jgi:hypothetical protein
MADRCELLDKCGFFQKYASSKELACRGFIAKYCKGPSMSDCKRKKYRLEHGKSPSDDMLPNGLMMAAICTA